MDFNKYHNLYQILNDFQKIDSIETMKSTEFDLSYYGVEYNSIADRFDSTNQIKTVDNRKTLGRLYTSEFCDDFTQYWNTIEANLQARGVDWNYYYSTKSDMILLIKNFSIYKGTKFFIEFIYDLYATLTTTEFWKSSQFEVAKYAFVFSNFKNLEYNLTGNLPSHIWESIIKPTVHPAGWTCNYFGNEYDDDYNIVSLDNNLRNDLCYIDFAGCNSIVNQIPGSDSSGLTERLFFDTLEIFQSDILSTRRVNFQNDSMIFTDDEELLNPQEN